MTRRDSGSNGVVGLPTWPAAVARPVNKAGAVPLVHLGVIVAPVPAHFRRVESPPRLTALAFFRHSCTGELKSLIFPTVISSYQSVRQLGFVGRRTLTEESWTLRFHTSKSYRANAANFPLSHGRWYASR